MKKTPEHSPNTPPCPDRGADVIVCGGLILTMKGDHNPIEEASIIVREGKIAAIERSLSPGAYKDTGTEVIDAREGLVMPGLINAHTHAAMTLFRGAADDMPLKQWLFERIFPAEAKYLNPESVYWGSLLACLEMIASGTTCFLDGYFFEDATARAAEESGIRALTAQGVIDFPAPGVRDPGENLKVGRKFIERWLGVSELITPGLFCHSPFTCSGTTLKRAWEISREYDLPLQIHLSETSEEVREVFKVSGKRPVHYLEQLGLLGEGLIAVHAVQLTKNEIALLANRGVKVVHVPESNMKLCSGVAKVPAMVKKGLIVGLGTDGCASNNNLDLFQEMDTAAKLSKVFPLDPVGLNAETVLKMTTVWGAALLGKAEHLGTIEIGKKADIIVIDLRQPHLCPIYEPASALVYSADGADVKDVIVSGRVLMKEREFKTLDAERVLGKVREITSKIHV